MKLLCHQVPAVYLAKQLNLYRSPLPPKKQFQTPLSLSFIILGINNFEHHIPHAIKYRSKNRHPLFARACKRNLNWTNTLCCQVCVRNGGRSKNWGGMGAFLVSNEKAFWRRRFCLELEAFWQGFYFHHFSYLKKVKKIYQNMVEISNKTILQFIVDPLGPTRFRRPCRVCAKSPIIVAYSLT